MPQISSLHIYPVKSLGGIALASAQVSRKGIAMGPALDAGG
jgi:uncharacterized protein YcbX